MSRISLAYLKNGGSAMEVRWKFAIGYGLFRIFKNNIKEDWP